MLGTNYVLNQNILSGEGLVDNLQAEYDSHPGLPSVKFFNGGQMGYSNIDIIKGSKIKISTIKPDYTILVTGLSFEVMNDCLSDLNPLSRLCPFERIRSATAASASLFLKNYINSVVQLQQAARVSGSKFVVWFLGAKMRKADLVKNLRLCSFLSDRLPNIEIKTDSIIQEFANNKIALIHSTFFSKILQENGLINKTGEFSPAANKKLARQVSFWLFPELAND